MNDYIQSMRKLVGHRPILLAGAAVLVFSSEGKILLTLRSDNHAWGLPGGCMEPGETLEETARRETFEETGVMPAAMELMNIYSGPEVFYEYPNGDQVYNVTAVYTCRDWTGTPCVHDHENQQIAFFNLHSLPDKISSPILPALNEAVRRFG